MIRIDEVFTEVVVEGTGDGAAPEGLDAERVRELVREVLREELEAALRTAEDRG